jgi:hypothetical protein
MPVVHQKNPWMSSVVGGQQTAGVEKSRETSCGIGDDVGCQHYGILYNELNNYERDSLKAFDNSSAHPL